MRHKHRIKPGYEGGEYKEGNVVVLSPTQHAMWHFAEWQRKQNMEDFIAWRAISGLISTEEAALEAMSLGGKKGGGVWNRDPANREKKRQLMLGKRHSKRCKEKMSESQQKRVSSGNHPFLDPSWDRFEAARKGVESRDRGENYRIVQENKERIVRWYEQSKTRKIRGRKPGRTACNRELNLNLTDLGALRNFLDELKKID